MIREYSSVYLPMHESLVNKIDASRKQIQDAITGNDIKALWGLDGITALQPASTGKLVELLTRLSSEIFECPSPSRASVEDHLRNGPLHECGLSFVNASTHVQAAESAAKRAIEMLDNAFRRKMEVFLNPSVRGRLEQGRQSLLSPDCWRARIRTSFEGISSKRYRILLALWTSSIGTLNASL